MSHKGNQKTKTKPKPKDLFFPQENEIKNSRI